MLHFGKIFSEVREMKKSEIASPENFSKLDAPVTREIKFPFSSEIMRYIDSAEELEIYKNAKLREGVVNGRVCLLRDDIDWTQRDEFGQSNLERIKNGNPPIYSNGEIIELHHIGQKPDSPFAELTRTEHRGKGNDLILHDKAKISEIDRNVFQHERREHWQYRGSEIRE